MLKSPPSQYSVIMPTTGDESSKGYEGWEMSLAEEVGVDEVLIATQDVGVMELEAGMSVIRES